MENVVGVLKGLRGRTVDTVYDLFFTDKRIVAAILIHPSDFNDIYGKIDLTTILVGGLHKERAVKMRSLDLTESRRSDFADKTVDEILALHKSNFQIDYENIIHVTVKEGLLTKSLEIALKNPPGKRLNFSLEKGQVTEAEELVQKVLTGKEKLPASSLENNRR